MKKYAGGVTLIEALIYVVLASLMLLSMGIFVSDIILGREKAFVINENQHVSQIAFEHMEREIEQAVTLNTGSSTFGSHPGVLSIGHLIGSLDPTVFDISAGRLRMTQGVNTPEFLTPAWMTVTNLVFTNLSNGSQNVVRIEMTVETNRANGAADFTANRSYVTSVYLHN
jgi:hypothetical protein